MADQLLSESDLLAPIDGFDGASDPQSADNSGLGDDLFGDFGGAPAADPFAGGDAFQAAPAPAPVEAVAHDFDFPAPTPDADLTLDFAAAPAPPASSFARVDDLFAEPAAHFETAPASSAPAVASSAPKTNLSLYTQAEPGVGLVDDSSLREWQRKHNEELAKKEQESQRRHKEIIAEAEADVAKFFADRAHATSARARQNRENSVPVLDAAPAADKVWTNVSSLCDLTETHRATGSDVTRMRDVLISLKHN